MILLDAEQGMLGKGVTVRGAFRPLGGRRSHYGAYAMCSWVHQCVCVCVCVCVFRQSGCLSVHLIKRALPADGPRCEGDGVAPSPQLFLCSSVTHFVPFFTLFLFFCFTSLIVFVLFRFLKKTLEFDVKAQ